mmetsp:Transcript_21717/g.47698  ORF Transcript_21717/g.47698 Transcript_21717/m.47698 type:complete len:211 (-) Transcript_21717:1160-1792(-)
MPKGQPQPVRVADSAPHVAVELVGPEGDIVAQVGGQVGAHHWSEVPKHCLEHQVVCTARNELVVELVLVQQPSLRGPGDAAVAELVVVGVVDEMVHHVVQAAAPHHEARAEVQLAEGHEPPLLPAHGGVDVRGVHPQRLRGQPHQPREWLHHHVLLQLARRLAHPLLVGEEGVRIQPHHLGAVRGQVVQRNVKHPLFLPQHILRVGAPLD